MILVVSTTQRRVHFFSSEVGAGSGFSRSAEVAVQFLFLGSYLCALYLRKAS